MKKGTLILFSTCFFMFSGQADACICSLPEEYADLKIENLQYLDKISVSLEKKELLMRVSHEVKGSDVYIECIVDNFTFAKEKVGKSHKEGEGHLYLYVDGHKVDTIAQPAFIIKGLPTGKHTIKLELVQNDQKSYGLEEEFSVQVP